MRSTPRSSAWSQRATTSPWPRTPPPWRPRPAFGSGRGPCAGHSSASDRRDKKKTLRAAERDRDDIVEAREARQEWQTTVAGVEPARLVFIDESAALTDLVRLYARSPKGQRAYGTVPGGQRKRLAVCSAPSGWAA